MRALLVYYSRTGHTRKIAEEITKELQCDMDEIIDTVNRSGAGGFMTCGRQATKKELTKILPPKKDPSQYDVVIIGTPVWALTMSSPVRTYIVENKDKLKKVAFFITFGGFGAESTFHDLEDLCGKAASGTLAINTPSLKEGNYLDGVKQFSEIIKGLQ
ncbi:MAG: flavodoxin [Methanocella sp. PtaU1.Bin125]|nr:MAG: flavodoxin [Methanocella sp. PtaU1.Bin125]